MRIKVAGTLYWGNMSWLLVDPHPLTEREPWMKDQDETFLVCDILGHQFKVTVSRPFAVTDELQ